MSIIDKINGEDFLEACISVIISRRTSRKLVNNAEEKHLNKIINNAIEAQESISDEYETGANDMKELLHFFLDYVDLPEVRDRLWPR